MTESRECPDCQGTGVHWSHEEPCPACEGRGRYIYEIGTFTEGPQPDIQITPKQD